MPQCHHGAFSIEVSSAVNSCECEHSLPHQHFIAYLYHQWQMSGYSACWLTFQGDLENTNPIILCSLFQMLVPLIGHARKSSVIELWDTRFWHGESEHNWMQNMFSQKIGRLWWLRVDIDWFSAHPKQLLKISFLHLLTGHLPISRGLTHAVLSSHHVSVRYDSVWLLGNCQVGRTQRDDPWLRPQLWLTNGGFLHPFLTWRLRQF